MIVNDLFLGEIEGSDEFKTKENIEKLYYLGIREDDIENLILGTKRYIHGYKGTGKTSLIMLLENKCKDRKIPYISISYRKIREDAEVIHEFRKKFKVLKEQFDNEEDQDTITLTFWKWYILSLIAKNYIDYNANDLIQTTRQKFFYAIAAVLDMIVVTFDPYGKISIGIDIEANCFHDSEEENIIKAARSIRKLAAKIQERLTQKVIIFIDEVELTKARSTYGIDRIMIKNLLIATKYINDITDKLHIVLAVRNEVVYDLRGDEINKLLEGYGVHLSWWNSNHITIDHPLWQLMFKKIRFSMREHGETSSLTNKQLWDRWFPFRLADKESWKFLFELTWARPRDFVRLLSNLQEHCRDQVHFTRSGYNMAIQNYSQNAFSEVAEEISTLFDDFTMAKISNILQQIGMNFHSYTFIKRARNVGIESPSIVLDEMYRVGLVGQHYRDRNNYGKWRFFYRNDMKPDLSKPFEIHRALLDSLGVKNKFNKAVFYS